jgi:hypothetical protein
MYMTVEMYEQAVHKALKEAAIVLLRPIKPLSEIAPVGTPIRA